jgi:hypothetical protein
MLLFYIIISVVAMIVKNISNIEYFLQRAEAIDTSYRYHVKYHPKAPTSTFDSPETFVMEFRNCQVHSCPLLITENNEIITEHVWPLLHKYKNKPEKTHRLWKNSGWTDTMEIDLPSASRSFGEPYKYVWLPIDQESANNPWHIWIDIISKFRLLEKRYAVDYENQIYILSQKSEYFEKVAKELFPNLKFLVMPKNTTWHFDHLIVPSMSNSNDGVVVPELPSWLRQKFAPRGKKQTKKVWISRKNSPTRNIINEDEVFLILKGWTMAKLETMSFQEQMNLFAEAEVVVAPHGAGLINLLWCYPKTKIVEFQDIEMLSKKVYPLLAHHLGLEHKTYTANTVPVTTEGNKKPAGVKRKSDLVNFKINITELLEFFKKENIA